MRVRLRRPGGLLLLVLAVAACRATLAAGAPTPTPTPVVQAADPTPSISTASALAAIEAQRAVAGEAYLALTAVLNTDLARLKGGLTRGEAAVRASYLAYADFRRRWLDGLGAIDVPTDAEGELDRAVAAVAERRRLSDALARAPTVDWDRLLAGWRAAGLAEVDAVNALRAALGIRAVPPVPPVAIPDPSPLGGHQHR